MRFFSCSSFNAASFVWKAGTNGRVRRLEAVLVVSAATSMRCLFSAGRHRVPDGDGFVLKVDRVPFEPHHLAAAQSVECRQHDRQFQRGSPRCLKEPVHLVAVIKRGGNRSFLGRSTLSAGLTSMRSVLTAYLSALWMIAW